MRETGRRRRRRRRRLAARAASGSPLAPAPLHTPRTDRSDRSAPYTARSASYVIAATKACLEKITTIDTTMWKLKTLVIFLVLSLFFFNLTFAKKRRTKKPKRNHDDEAGTSELVHYPSYGYDENEAVSDLIPSGSSHMGGLEPGASILGVKSLPPRLYAPAFPTALDTLTSDNNYDEGTRVQSSNDFGSLHFAQNAYHFPRVPGYEIANSQSQELTTQDMFDAYGQEDESPVYGTRLSSNIKHEKAKIYGDSNMNKNVYDHETQNPPDDDQAMKTSIFNGFKTFPKVLDFTNIKKPYEADFTKNYNRNNENSYNTDNLESAHDLSGVLTKPKSNGIHSQSFGYTSDLSSNTKNSEVDSENNFKQESTKGELDYADPKYTFKNSELYSSYKDMYKDSPLQSFSSKIHNELDYSNWKHAIKGTKARKNSTRNKPEFLKFKDSSNLDNTGSQTSVVNIVEHPNLQSQKYDYDNKDNEYNTLDKTATKNTKLYTNVVDYTNTHAWDSLNQANIGLDELLQATDTPQSHFSFSLENDEKLKSIEFPKSSKNPSSWSVFENYGKDDEADFVKPKKKPVSSNNFNDGSDYLGSTKSPFSYYDSEGNAYDDIFSAKTPKEAFQGNKHSLSSETSHWGSAYKDYLNYHLDKKPLTDFDDADIESVIHIPKKHSTKSNKYSSKFNEESISSNNLKYGSTKHSKKPDEWKSSGRYGSKPSDIQSYKYGYGAVYGKPIDEWNKDVANRFKSEEELLGLRNHDTSHPSYLPSFDMDQEINHTTTYAASFKNYAAALEEWQKMKMQALDAESAAAEATGASGHRHVHVPVPKPYPVGIPQPVLVPVPAPYPVRVPVPRPVAVPVLKQLLVPVEKPVPYPVVKKVPYPVEKPVPVPIEKPVAYPVMKPYPVPIPHVRPVFHHARRPRRPLRDDDGPRRPLRDDDGPRRPLRDDEDAPPRSRRPRRPHAATRSMRRTRARSPQRPPRPPRRVRTARPPRVLLRSLPPRPPRAPRRTPHPVDYEE